MFNVAHISNGDIQGGAAKAANRLHRCLLKSGDESRMIVRYKATDDWRVISPDGFFSGTINRLRSPIGKMVSLMQKHAYDGSRNGAWLPSNFSQIINSADIDVVNLHWIASETVSVGDILRIKRPLVWTLHDMWPFCGMEHYVTTGVEARWRVGYRHDNRLSDARGLDLDRKLWLKKMKLKKRQMTVVSPSRWLGDCARQSVIFAEMPIEVIPHPLDLSLFRPMERSFCRNVLRLPQDTKLIMFGAVGGSENNRKGFDLLEAAFWRMHQKKNLHDTHCCIFGQGQPQTLPNLPLPCHWLGRLNDDITLAMAYSAADIMVVPSRQEAFGLTAAEASACGCPVLAFRETGVADIVMHKDTGYLAKPFELDDLVTGLEWLLESDVRRRKLCIKARDKAEAFWAPEIIASKYHDVYSSSIDAYHKMG